MGSILDAIAIPVGSADLVLAGILDSVAHVVGGVTALFGDVIGSVQGLS